MFGILQDRETLDGSSSASSDNYEVKDRRAVSDTGAAQIDATGKRTKRTGLQLGGASSSPAKYKAGKGLLHLRRKGCNHIVLLSLRKKRVQLGLIKFYKFRGVFDILRPNGERRNGLLDKNLIVVHRVHAIIPFILEQNTLIATAMFCSTDRLTETGFFIVISFLKHSIIKID